MNKLKLSLIVLLVYLTLIFNLERLEYKAGFTGMGVHTFVYMLVLFAIISLLGVPSPQKLSLFPFLLFWAVVYFILRYTIFNDNLVWGGINTYITITEIIILLIAVAIGDHVARNLREFEQFVEKVTIPGLGNRILSKESANEELKTEFIRSRRHKRPLALLVVQASSGSFQAELKRAVMEIQRRMTDRFIAASLAQVINNEARRTDMIINLEDEGLYVIVCPETGADGTLRLGQRIQSVAMHRIGVPISFGTASFPKDALTYEDLLEKAQLSLGQSLAESAEQAESSNTDQVFHR